MPHAVPLVHEVQPPSPSQTRLVPHVTPATAGGPLEHTGTPLLHSTLPVTHGCPVLLVHELPCAQAMHEPLPLHTLS